MAGREVQESPTAMRILDVAEQLVQVRGFNGFSYADVAAELQLTKAALHYHFASKNELGEALIERYSARFGESLDDLEARYPDAPLRLRHYAGLYAQVLRDGRMCLCGMMAADYETLPSSTRTAVLGFIRVNREWLSRVLAQGREQGSLTFSGSPSEVALLVFGGLEGAMLIARPLGDIVGFETSVDRLLKGLLPTTSTASRSTR
jgi:TetR/AcrR family transcriptional regulator, transcriptional repressor for nem operon